MKDTFVVVYFQGLNYHENIVQLSLVAFTIRLIDLFSVMISK